MCHVCSTGSSLSEQRVQDTQLSRIGGLEGFQGLLKFRIKWSTPGYTDVQSKFSSSIGSIESSLSCADKIISSPLE